MKKQGIYLAPLLVTVLGVVACTKKEENKSAAPKAAATKEIAANNTNTKEDAKKCADPKAVLEGVSSYESSKLAEISVKVVPSSVERVSHKESPNQVEIEVFEDVRKPMDLDSSDMKLGNGEGEISYETAINGLEDYIQVLDQAFNECAPQFEYEQYIGLTERKASALALIESLREMELSTRVDGNSSSTDEIDGVSQQIESHYANQSSSKSNSTDTQSAGTSNDGSGDQGSNK